MLTRRKLQKDYMPCRSIELELTSEEDTPHMWALLTLLALFSYAEFSQIMRLIMHDTPFRKHYTYIDPEIGLGILVCIYQMGRHSNVTK